MREYRPSSEPELAEAMSAARGVTELGGAFSKRRMNPGAGGRPDVVISTGGMRRVIQYEPRDLTVSVEAGLPFAELSGILADHRQMVPLDPPYFDTATVGGVVAANTTGPRRRLYGTVRDMVIGMTFAKLDGKLTKSGGTVVKNVAGFDMAKLMVGSFGTLAAIAVVNFKLSPMPPEARTFLMQFDTAQAGMKAREELLRSVLQPAAMDALNPAASRRVGLDGFVLAVQSGGSATVMARYARDLAESRTLEGEAERRWWESIREFTPAFANEHGEAAIARVSSTLMETAAVFASTTAPVVSRAASGISYVYFDRPDAAQAWMARPETAKWRYVFEYGEPASNGVFGSEFEMMKVVKNLFDPKAVLNPGRLYGRI
jgi:glycolate oxidase FAD binding subunit